MANTTYNSTKIRNLKLQKLKGKENEVFIKISVVFVMKWCMQNKVKLFQFEEDVFSKGE